MKTQSRLIFAVATIWISTFPVGFGASDLFAQSHYPGQHSNKIVVADKIPIKALSFEVKDALLEKITLIPYYQIHRERYVVYWKIK